MNKNKFSDLFEIYKSDKLSYYRTMHEFCCYFEVKSLEDVKKVIISSKSIGRNIYVLGNGSNTLFAKKQISSLVVKNSLPREMRLIDDDVYCVSSSCSVQAVLNFCYDNSLQSFYYLSSVPATIGGAIAMNAGRGRKYGASILDFVQTVSYLDKNGDIRSLDVSRLNSEYRYTMFLDDFKGFIVSAEFRFPHMSKSVPENNPIKERLEWASKYLDDRPRSCGSVFKVADFRLLGIVKGMRLFGAEFSKKTINWIVNSSSSSFGILACILVVKLLHLILFRKNSLEIRVVW